MHPHYALRIMHYALRSVPPNYDRGPWVRHVLCDIAAVDSFTNHLVH